MIDWTLQAAADAAELLDRDEDHRAHWRKVAVDLAPYPTWQTEEGPIYGQVAGVDPTAEEYNWFHGVIPTVLADRITLDSPRDQVDTMLRTALAVGGWNNQEVFHLLGAFPDRTKGVPASEANPATSDVPLDRPAKQLDVFCRQPERLLNSRGGRVHLFPCVPPGATVAFRRFQARGGFLVGAEMRAGEVTYVCIEARRSAPCRVMNPWCGRAVQVVESSSGRLVFHRVEPGPGECLVFAARRGVGYTVQPDQPSDAREKSTDQNREKPVK